MIGRLKLGGPSKRCTVVSNSTETSTPSSSDQVLVRFDGYTDHMWLPISLIQLVDALPFDPMHVPTGIDGVPCGGSSDNSDHKALKLASWSADEFARQIQRRGITAVAFDFDGVIVPITSHDCGTHSVCQGLS